MIGHCIVTCEHGGNRLPTRFRSLFRDQWQVLHSHRGYDLGALRLSREMAKMLDAEHYYSVVSRLLVDLNRTVGHHEHLSPTVAALDLPTQLEIVQQYYDPYRNAVEHSVADALARDQRVFHLSCHSFTEQLGHQIRDAEIGLLFDPVRVAESVLCSHWKDTLEELRPDLTVRFNYPYLGVDDGFIPALRGRYPHPLYVGVEIEVRQDVAARADVRQALATSLRAALGRFAGRRATDAPAPV